MTSDNEGRHDSPPGPMHVDSDAPTLKTPIGSSQPRGSADPSADKTEMIGHYRIVRLLGKGGMGRVFLAVDTTLDRPVALKVVRADLADNPTNVERFRREARSVARLNHPNIVQIYEFGQHEGKPFYAMEYVEGKTLARALDERGAIPVGEAVGLLANAVDALDYALEHHVVHRDVKPGNMLITPSGQIKIVDFGLSRCLEGDIDLTQSGAVIGSPHYMSPEQSRGEKVDHRSDIYSLGVTFYHMLTGERPFDASSPLAIMLKHIQDPVPEPETLRDLLDGRVLAVLSRMLAKNPDDRYQDYATLRRDLLALSHRAPPESTILQGVAVVAGKSGGSAAAPPVSSSRLSVSGTLPAGTPGKGPSAPTRTRRRALIVVIAAMALLAGVAAIVALGIARANAKRSRTTPPLYTGRSVIASASDSVGSPQATASLSPEPTVTQQSTLPTASQSTPETLLPTPLARASASPPPEPAPRPKRRIPPGATNIDGRLGVLRNHIRSLQFDDALAELDEIEEILRSENRPGAARVGARFRSWRPVLVDLDHLKRAVIGALNADRARPLVLTLPAPLRRISVQGASDECLTVLPARGSATRRVSWSEIQPGAFFMLALRTLPRPLSSEQKRGLVCLTRVLDVPASEARAFDPAGAGIDQRVLKDLSDFVGSGAAAPGARKPPLH